MKKLLCLVLSLFVLPNLSHAQNPGTGAYAFAPLDTPGFDSINLGNLNTRFTIPIVSRQGRGQGFNYSLQYEGLIWTNSNGTWVPDPSWGFTGQLNGTGFTGYLSHTETPIKCSGTQGLHDTKLQNFVYHDAFGGQHRFKYTDQYNICGLGDPIITGDGSSSDGSGYTLVNESSVTTRNGTTIVPSLSPTGSSSTSITDRNGNQVSSNGNGAYTDTLGVTALSVSGSNPISFTYPVTEQTNGATTASATLSYQTYTVRTNFGCSGIVEYGSTSVSLPHRLTLADQSYYEFSYETTYQATDGAVTGRLGSVRLPTGGTIQYSYTNGCGAGINADGTVGSLTRITSDGTRSYGRAPLNGNSTSTTLQDEKGNQTLISFTIDSSTQNFYETHRTVHQGDLSQAALSDIFTCYNGTTAPCDSTAITLPISEADTTASYNGGSQVLTKNYYDANGSLLTESDVYNGSTILHQTITSYNSLGEPLSINKYGGSNTPYATTTYGYDETGVTATSGLPQHTTAAGQRGNLTSVHVTGSPNINTSTTYYDTGMAASSTAADGGTTSYTYDATGAFVQGTALPTPSSGVALSTSASYDATSASLLNSSGMNAGETTTITNYDALLRPIGMTLPSGSQVYTDPTVATPIHSMVHQNLDSGRTAQFETLLDGYGRVSRVGQLNGNANNGWNQVDYCYDASGLLQFQSATYQSTGEKDANGNDTPKHRSGAGTSYQYDALGRVTSTTTPDGTDTTQYNNRAVKKTDVNNVQRITQYDLLGRISSVCEISSATLGGLSPTSCGADIAGTGFVTQYTYDLNNHQTQIRQDVQVRTFVTDPAGRITSITEPESGLTSYGYSYNSTGLVVQRARSKANQSDPNVHTTTTTQYDRLGRVININYDDGLTPNKWFFYDVSPTGSSWIDPGANLKGRLAATTADEAASNQHAWTHYSYNIAGNVTSMYQCATSTCGTTAQEGRPALQFSYDLAGSLMSEADGASGTISYGRSVLEQVTSVTNLGYTDAYNTPNLVTNVVNGPFGPTNWHLGNNTSAIQRFDDSGRPNGGWLCTGTNADGQSGGCAGTNSQLYGYVAATIGSHTTGICDTAVNSCMNTTYDDFNRLTGASGATNFNWTYDRWGNRLSQTGSPSVLNHFDSGSNHSTDYSYDAAGNQTNDAVHSSYTYDAEGKVLAVDGNTARYFYNAFDQRVRVQTANSTYEYLFDPFGRRMSSWLLNGSASGAGNEGRIYWDYGLLANRAWNGTTYFHHTNWLGTERVRTDWQGNVANQQASNAFGDGLTQTSSDIYGGAQDNNQFTSQEQDAESGTIHFQYRQYASTQGRWMSPDPYAGSYNWKNPQSLNRYTYALNSPFSFVDPDGLLCVLPSNYNSSNGQIGGQPPSTSVGCIAAGGVWQDDNYNPYDPNWNVTVNGNGNSNGGSYAGSGSGNADSGDNGATGGVVPNDPTAKEIACIKEGLGKNAVSLGLDVLGFIPGGSGAALIFQTAVGVTSLAHSAMSADTSRTGSVGLTSTFAGFHLTAIAPAARLSLRTEEGFAQTFLKSLPAIGTALNVISTGADAISTAKDIATCLKTR